jgi:hypothetical protein
MVKSLSLLLVFLQVFATGRDEIALAYNFKTGDTFSLQQKTEQVVKQTIMGMQQTGNNAYDGTIAFRVISTTDEGARLEARMVTLKSRMKNILNEVNMDSEGPADNSSSKILRAMMNRPFFVTISKFGTITKVEDVDNLWTGVNALDIADDEKQKVKTSIGQMINESSFRNGLGQAFLTYPSKPVQLQEKWLTNAGIPADFPVRSDNVWFVETMSAGNATIKGDGTFKTTDREKIVALPGDLKAKVNLAGSQHVTSTVTVRTGVPERVAIQSKLEGTLLLLAGGLLPMDVEVPIAIETQTTYSFVRK